jgi:glycosyltransferase involved in cell wall biosynthesis
VTSSETRPKRLLWAVNHKTLLPAEVPILRNLGYEVFIPKVVPDRDPGFRSALVTYEYDNSLTIPKTALRILNNENFYERSWSATPAALINEHFDVFVSHFSYYTIPLSEAARKFEGLVVARTFGRESPRRYAEFAEHGPRTSILDELELIEDRFIHAQGYSNLSEIEPPILQRAAATVAVPLPQSFYTAVEPWRGGGTKAVFLCPSIGIPGDRGYYTEVYDGIKQEFGDLPHVIFGRQHLAIPDPAILPYLTDQQLLDLYASAPVFVYPSREERHVHYSPIEAMIVGTPVLYRRGALIDTLAEHADLAGACASTEEMREKALRLIAGDRALADAIRSGQQPIIDTFSTDVATRQWEEVLKQVPARSAA